MYIDCGIYFGIQDYIKSVLLILYASILSSTLMGFFISFLRTGSSFSTLSIIVGTLIGFLTGIYVPVGILPTGIQYIVKFFPFSHISILFRDLLMKEPLKQMINAVGNIDVPVETMVNEYKELYGIEFTIGNHTISNVESIIYILFIIIISSILFVYNFNRKKEKFSRLIDYNK